MKYKKRVVVMISKTNASKNKFFYKYDDRLCEDTFIDWCKPINDIELTIR
jgi:hypothetical protein